MMDKALATFRLGNTEEKAAKWIGISVDVYRQWPERLHPVMTDRVYAAILRMETARAMGQTSRQFFADYRGEAIIETMLTRVSIASVMASMLPRVPPEFEAREDQRNPPPSTTTTTTTRKRPGRNARPPRASNDASTPPQEAVTG